MPDSAHAILFDLDDTLYSEYSFLRSGFENLSQWLSVECGESPDQIFSQMIEAYHAHRNAMKEVLETFQISSLSIEDLLLRYRTHDPQIKPYDGVVDLLSCLKRNDFSVGIITDGRSVTQRLKLKVLAIEDFVDVVVISEELGTEKPSEQNYIYVEEKLHCASYTYVGDNLAKDFVVPNQRGWFSIGLKDQGQNIHPQTLAVAPEYCPQKYAADFRDVGPLLEELLEIRIY